MLKYTLHRYRITNTSEILKDFVYSPEKKQRKNYPICGNICKGQCLTDLVVDVICLLVEYL